MGKLVPLGILTTKPPTSISGGSSLHKDIDIYTGYRDKGHIIKQVPSGHLYIRKGDTDARRR